MTAASQLFSTTRTARAADASTELVDVEIDGNTAITADSSSAPHNDWIRIRSEGPLA